MLKVDLEAGDDTLLDLDWILSQLLQYLGRIFVLELGEWALGLAENLELIILGLLKLGFSQFAWRQTCVNVHHIDGLVSRQFAWLLTGKLLLMSGHNLLLGHSL